MSNQIADIVMHIDENTTHETRERLRDELLSIDGVMAADYQDEKPHLISIDGVMAADYQDEKPHLMVMAYDPDVVNSLTFVKTAEDQGLHAELVGL